MYNDLRTELLTEASCHAAKARRLDRVVTRQYDRALRPAGLTVAQLDLLATLLGTPAGMRPVDLGERMQIDASTVSRDLARLSKSGLVRLGPAASRRERIAHVTPAGRRLAARAIPLWRLAQSRTARILGPDGIAALDLLASRVRSPATNGKGVD